MSIEAHWRGLSRLLLGAAFLLLGWLFVSATPASADDVLTSVVGGVTEPLTSATEPEAESAPTVVEDVAAPVTETVEDVVVAVVESEPVPVVETVTEPLATTVQPVAQAVEDSVSTTVASAVEATTEVVETVVSGVGTVVGTASELPVEGMLPGAQVEVPGVTSDGSEPAAVAAVRPAGAERHAAYVPVVGPAASFAAPAPAESRTSAGSGTERAAGIPQPPVRGPVPTGPEAGVLPAPSNASSGGSAGADAASTPLAFSLPTAMSLAPLRAVQHPAAGPVPDPGSRPD